MYKLLLPFLIPVFCFGQTQIGNDIDGEAVEDQSGYSISISNDGSYLAIGAPFNDGNGPSSGHVRVYQNVGVNWTQIGADIDGEFADDLSGASVAISGDGSVVAIGANVNPGNGTNSGHVRIYQNAGNVWTQIGNDIDGEAAFDQSGYSLALSDDGSIVAIGANGNSGNGTNSGHVRVYMNNGGVWTQLGLDIDGEAANDQSGTSVSLSADGSIVSIGANRNDGNGADSGHVRIFKYDGGVWTQQGTDIDGEAVSDQSGFSVSMSDDGTIVAIGATQNDGNGVDSGHVRVYQYLANSWTQVGLDINGESVLDNTGYSVSLSGDGRVLAIGAINNDGNGNASGHARIYQYVNGVWTQAGMDIDGEAAGDQFGYSVSLSDDGNTVAVSSRANNGNGSFSGHVRVYDLSSVLANTTFEPANFGIHPNPVSEILNISLPKHIRLERVSLYNALGQIVKTLSSTKIDISNLQSGVYLVHVYTNKGEVVKRIVIE